MRSAKPADMTPPAAEAALPGDGMVTLQEFHVAELSERDDTRYQRVVKPVLDAAAALALLVLTLPLMAAVAVAVRVVLGRGVIYRQERVGRGGRPFVIYKFRTMHPDRRKAIVPSDDPDRRLCHKTDDDPRHTPLGQFLRKYSLDELPQLWNVARGDMSLVGPRPELSEVVQRYEPWQRGRHRVRPGLTGLWQVTRRGEGLAHENVELDLEYIDHLSLATDLKILALTVPVVLFGSGGK